MIFGGVNAAGRTGGMRASRSETYLPCSVNVVNADIKAIIEQSTPSVAVWQASARIRNLTDTAWVDLGSASYFQVTRDPAGDLDTADATLQQPEVWSPWLSTYPGLLSPSTRRIQIRAGLVVGSSWYPTVAFSGCVSTYSEAIGVSGGGISLRLVDSRDQVRRGAAALISTGSASTYRLMLQQGLQLRVALRDAIIEDTSKMSYSNAVAAIEAQFSTSPLLRITGSGAIKAQQDNTADAGNAQFAYSDANIHVATRRYNNDEAVNVVRCYGLSGGVGTIAEVQDDADVLLRGRVVYPAGLIGSPSMTLDEAKEQGRLHIAASLRGIVDLEIPFNPYLLPGSTISLTSSRLGITDTYTKIYKMRHQYSVGRCRTYISGARFYGI